MTESHPDAVDVGSSDALPPEPVLLGALEAAHDGLVVTDLDGSPRYYNRRFLELFKLPDDALTDTSLEEALEEIRVQFSNPERLQEAVKNNLEDPSSVTEHEFKLRDGTVIHRVSRPLTIAGEVAGRVTTIRDVTEERKNERRLREAQRLTSVGSWEWDIEEDVVHWSDELYRIFGLDAEEFDATYEAFLDRVHPEDRDKVQEAVEAALQARKDYRVQFRIVRTDDEVRHTQAVGEVVTDHEGEPVLLRGALQDITDLTESRRARERAERRYRTLFEMSPLALSVSRPDGQMVAVNDRFETLLGHTSEYVQGKRVQKLDIWVDRKDRARLLRRVDSDGVVRDYETQLRTASGELIEAELSVDQVTLDKESYLAWAIRDVTDRNQYRRELEQKALYDQLTALPNRNLLFDRIGHAVRRAERKEEPLSVLFIDLDKFKAINTSYGHTVGDRVLAETATRLQAVLRDADTLGRIGGDEFLAILQDTDEAGAQKVARRLLNMLDDSRFEVLDGTVKLGASIGIAPLTIDRRKPAELIRAADAAMQRVKKSEQEKHRFRVYDSDDAAVMTRVQRRERLRKALEEDEFVLYYQPVIDLYENRISGAEALIRWEHPERGLVSPGEFIPVAEEAGLIGQVDAWALRKAVSQGAELLEQSPRDPEDSPFQVAVNVSAPFYQSPDFSDQVWEALEEGGLAGDRLQLEITERLLVSKIGGWSRLRAGGITLAVDDFGTGYSSLRYLRQLEADVLKIDRYFIAELTSEPTRSSALVLSMLSLGEQMGMEVVAEGVETPEQRDHLVDMGCHYAQGYFFARPMPADDLAEVLADDGASLLT